MAYVILPAWLGPLSLLNWGLAHTSAPHWIRVRVQICGWQLRSRHILYMATIYAKTKVLHSAYCPTRRCTHNPPLCLSLSTARLLRLMYALVFIILLLSLDLPTVRQFLLRQTQLKCVMFGQLKDTKGVNDTVKVLKCCGISIFICSFLKVPCQCLHTLCSVGGVFS